MVIAIRDSCVPEQNDIIRNNRNKNERSSANKRTNIVRYYAIIATT